ncbi:MAG: DUF2066 domain-containing protein [Pseudomonadota bacterium]
MHIRSRDPGACATFIVVVLTVIMAGLTAARADGVYTVANYPVEATAKDAVTAKERAIQDGRTAAFRSLLKRIVPVTSYERMNALRQIDPHPLTSSVAVRSERSSATRYIATLDFSFSPDAVQAELKRAGIPYVDTQAPSTIVVTIYSPPDAGTAGVTDEMGAATGNELWRSVWADLDLKNSPAPIELRRRAGNLQAATVQSIAGGNFGALSKLASHYGQPQVVLAIAEPDLSAKKLNVVVTGQDATGFFSLKRQYRIDEEDFSYTLALAAVISQGVIEGRWKEIKAVSPETRITAQTAEDVKIWVEFTGFAHWQRLQRTLQEVPGVEDFQTSGLSADGANVQLRYPGGGQQLQRVLAKQGLTLERYQDAWLLR